MVVMPRPVELLSGEMNRPSDWRAPIVTIKMPAADKVTTTADLLQVLIDALCQRGFTNPVSGAGRVCVWHAVSPLCPVVRGLSRFATMSFLAGFGRYPELARRDGAQLLAKHRRALATERRLELHLRLAPQPARNTKPLGTCPGQMQF